MQNAKHQTTRYLAPKGSKVSTRDRIIEDCIGFEALYISALKCKLNVLWKASVGSYITHILERTYLLEKELKNGTYKPRPPKRFTIRIPKEREILSIAFRDRVYQRSLNDNSIYPSAVKSFIDGNTACQKGKGTDYARGLFEKYAKRIYIRERKEVYALKCDIKKYYDNIPHNKVNELMSKKLDPWTSQRCIEVLSNQYVSDKGYNAGSQMVQIVGISYLDSLDHFIKEKLRCKEYLRYMDDFILFSTDTFELINWRDILKEKVKEYGLELHKDKTKIYSLSKGMTFLGFKYRLTNTGKLIKTVSKRNVKNRKQKQRKLIRISNLGIMAKEDVDNSFESWKAHALKGNSFNLRKYFNNYYKQLWEENMELSPREKALLEYALANAEKLVMKSEEEESIIDYNVMMGNLEAPTEEE